MIKFFAVCLSFAALLGGAVGADFPSAVFHAEFDRNFQALSNQGTIEGKHSQEILWETLAAYLPAGLKGNAAMVGTGADGKQDFHIEYPNRGFFSPSKGSIAFWVNPLDWRPDDKHFHVFFRAQGRDADLIVYKGPWSSHLLFLIGPMRKENGRNIWTIVKADIKDWKSGQWYFVTAAWGDGKASLYLNGKQAGESDYKNIPENDFVHFGVGGLFPLKWNTPQDFSLIDDLMIYNQALTPAEVRARYASYGYGFLPDDGKTPVTAQQIFSMADPAAGMFRVNFVLNQAEPDGTPFRTEAQVIDRNGKELIRQPVTSESSRYQAVFPLDKLPPGEYTLKLQTLRRDETSRGEASHAFTIPQTPESWRNNAIGEQPAVPAPWTEPSWNAADAVFDCWNRQYSFGNSALPAQIRSGKEELLAAPIALLLDGKPVSLPRLAKSQAIRDGFQLESEGNDPNFSIRSQVTAEFDGFIWFDLLLTPKQSLEVQSLTLDIPFLPAASTLFNAMNKQYFEFQPGHQGTIRNYSMDLYLNSRAVFIGNDDHGLEWFCEELSSWYNRTPQNSLQIIPGKQSNLLRLNLIDHRRTISAPLRYRFGIQATPVRPLPEQWRLQRVLAKDANSFDPWFPWATLHNIPDPELIKPDYQETLAKKQLDNHRVFHYFAGFTNSPYTPEWSYYGGIWSKQSPALGHYGSLNEREWAFAWNCPADRSYRDYYLQHLSDTVEKLNIQHLYFDNQDAQLCQNPLHHCGWTGTDGNRYDTFNLLATRDLVKRIYKMFKEKRPDGLIMRHMSAKPVTPVVGFGDMLADGELYNGTVGKEESYFNIFSPDMFRAAFRTQPFGVPNYFIPQFQRAIRAHSPIPRRYEDAWLKPEDMLKHRAKLRHFTGYFLVHDALIWPAFGVSIKEWLQIQDRFGFNGQERFILYRSPDSPFAGSADVLVSCYVLDGRMLAVAMNLSAGSEVTVELLPEKLKALGVKATRLVDAETGAVIVPANNTFRVQLQPNDYAVWIVE